MANRYRNAFYYSSNTNQIVTYTCPTDARAIIQNIQVTNHAGSNPDFEVFISDASDSNEIHELGHIVLSSKTTENLAKGPVVLEEGDALLCQTSSANTASVVVSILETDRNQQ
jgi:hypothetical protein